MNHPESQLQQACYQFFRLQWPGKVFIHIPNERKSKMEVLRLLRCGLLSGTPDIFIPEPVFKDKGAGKILSCGLWIELKAKPNKPTDKQKLVMKALEDRWYAVAVCWTLNEFQAVVKRYFDGQ